MAGRTTTTTTATKRTSKVKPDAEAEAAAKGRRHSAKARRRLAMQKELGVRIREHLGEPDHGIARAERIGLKPPETVRELRTTLHAADSFTTAASNVAARSRGETAAEAAQRLHAESVAAEANASAWLAIAERADGFEAIRAECGGIVTCAALGQLVEEVRHRSGKTREAVWSMSTRELAESLTGIPAVASNAVALAAKGVAPRNALFREWYDKDGSDTHHRPTAIATRWNALPLEERKRICPGGFGTVSLATVKRFLYGGK